MAEKIGFLLDILKRYCPDIGKEEEEYFQNLSLCRPVVAFVIVYHLQDCVIHKMAMAYNPSLTLAEREEYWIGTGGPEKFFLEYPCARLEVFKKDICVAWNGFQVLLLALHAEQSACTLGHALPFSQLTNPEWEKWNDRLRRRFGPILDCES